MSSRRVRLLGLVAALALVAAGFGPAHGLVAASDGAADGLGLQAAPRNSAIDDATMRSDSLRIERVDGPRNVVERVLLAGSHAALPVPRSLAFSLHSQPARQPAPRPNAPSLGRAPPFTQ